MNNNRNKTILVSGTLAYDRIMDFPGRFKDRILPDKIHILSVSFLVNSLKENYGGTAGNIAYNLALLGERPIILALAGDDFGKYGSWLKKNGIEIKHIKKCPGITTASAYIITDQDDNQITGFYPGPQQKDYCQIANKFAKVDLAIVAPEKKEKMLKYIEHYKRLKIPYIFDSGQNVGDFTAKELSKAIKDAKVVIGNDYEIELIKKILKKNLYELVKMAQIIVMTKGARGSVIYNEGDKIEIPPAKPKNTCDPTGAGDAYRAGLMKGLINNWPLLKCGRLASVVSVYTVEKYGTQTHQFTWKELCGRYQDNYNENL